MSKTKDVDQTIHELYPTFFFIFFLQEKDIKNDRAANLLQKIYQSPATNLRSTILFCSCCLVCNKGHFFYQFLSIAKIGRWISCNMSYGPLDWELTVCSKTPFNTFFVSFSFPLNHAQKQTYKSMGEQQAY